ncbi:hypothetical protein NXX56_13410 [Bacteroides thetaiotaomicron]|nr:hypothetical protein [Bacteroides thetaiotaomicron]
MKKILIPVSIVAILLCASWKEDAKTVSPDRLFLADSGKSLFVTNRAGNELIKMSSDGQKAEQKVTLSSPVNAMTQDPSGNLLGGMRRKHRHDVRTGWKETFGAVKNKERCYAFGYLVQSGVQIALGDTTLQQ